MTLADAIAILDLYREQSALEQWKHKAALLDAFRVFVASRPNERDFAAHIQGLVAFPETLYILTIGRDGERG